MKLLSDERWKMVKAYLKAEALYCLQLYFAPLTGTIKGIRAECRRIEREYRGHKP